MDPRKAGNGFGAWCRAVTLDVARFKRPRAGCLVPPKASADRRICRPYLARKAFLRDVATASTDRSARRGDAFRPVRGNRRRASAAPGALRARPSHFRCSSNYGHFAASRQLSQRASNGHRRCKPDKRGPKDCVFKSGYPIATGLLNLKP